jgi:hypothetical protein
MEDTMTLPIISVIHQRQGRSSSPTVHRSARWWWAASLVLALTACGGGGSGGGTGGGITQTAQAYTSGVISGFGSVIVNGVRFDDSQADVFDDAGQRHSRDDLKLGMQVDIDSGRVDRASAKAQAVRINFGSALVGPVQAVDLAGSRLTVLGQVVEVTGTTVFDDNLPGGLAAITLGEVLEVHARLDSSRGLYVASRLEDRSGALAYKLRGTVSGLNTSTQSFSLGGAVINYASLSPAPVGLADGQRVRVMLATVPVGGQWVATALKLSDQRVEDRDEAEVEGLVSAWTSATQFSVNGLPVDASQASFPQGQTGVVLGARVEVEGRVTNGVLVATVVKVEDEHQRGQGEDFELHGALSALDNVAKTFVLRGVSVHYANVTDWRRIAPTDLANGVVIEVKGDLSPDRSSVMASRISRED